MQVSKVPLQDAYLIDVDRRVDHRGFFARTFCQREFQNHGLATVMVQSNLSHNDKKGTLRGMHYQAPPAEEAKLILCTRGRIYDVIVDVRSTSPTFTRWFGVELSADNNRMLYVPEGFAHGFITLEDDSDVMYQVSQFYTPGQERGIRYDDPAIGIKWPRRVTVISEKDETWPEFEPATVLEQ